MADFRSLLGRIVPLLTFRSSGSYWESRYRLGGHSGEGSRGEAADYKAKVINNFVASMRVTSIIEFGCGDGYQLKMLELPDYIGVDVSNTIIQRCRQMFASDPSKRFLSLDEYAGETADVAMSIDVIFHLIEDSIYDDYLDRLFNAAERFVIIYSTSADLRATKTPHVRHRDVTADVKRRFTGFERMSDAESILPPPVRFDRNIPTRFFLYRRTAR